MSASRAGERNPFPTRSRTRKPITCQAAEATAKYVTGPYRFEVLQGVSHWVPEHAPDDLNRLLLEHLGTQRAS